MKRLTLPADEQALLAVDLGPLHRALAHARVEVPGERVGRLVVVVVGVEQLEVQIGERSASCSSLVRRARNRDRNENTLQVGCDLGARDSESVDPFDAATVRDAYDAVAEDYAATFMDDLAELDLDRAVLDAAHSMGSAAPTRSSRWDAGRVRSAGTSRHAVLAASASISRRRCSSWRGEQAEGRVAACADLRSMPIRTGSCSGVVAFYSIQHFPRADLGPALTELGRRAAPRRHPRAGGAPRRGRDDLR